MRYFIILYCCIQSRIYRARLKDTGFVDVCSSFNESCISYPASRIPLKVLYHTPSVYLHRMEKSNFVDQIRIFCRSGHGGAGSKHFMRNKFTAMGGPDGGDGGRGGHIILRGNKNTWTLLHLRYFKNVLAEDGEGGSGNNKTGRFGKDVIIDVPLGTIARDEETGKQDAEIMEDGQEIIWIPGGRGGLGNSHFATPTNQAPEHAQPGEAGL